MNDQKKEAAVSDKATLSDTDLDKVAGGFVSSEHNAISGLPRPRRDPSMKEEEKNPKSKVDTLRLSCSPQEETRRREPAGFAITSAFFRPGIELFTQRFGLELRLQGGKRNEID